MALCFLPVPLMLKHTKKHLIKCLAVEVSPALYQIQIRTNIVLKQTLNLTKSSVDRVYAISKRDKHPV